jgi:glucose-1-phosphate cytidylyltransferase
MTEQKTPKVVILCGGQGMRLREETEHKPKPMVEIGGRPIVWHIMRHYARYGFRRFILCLGYRGDIIREYFLNYEYMNSDFTISLAHNRRTLEVHPRLNDPRDDDADWEVTLSDTGQSTMTGGRIKRIERYIDTDYFLATYGDGVSNVNIKAQVDFHKSHGKIATITGVSPISRFGTLVTEGDEVLDFAEKPELKGSLINGGFFVFHKKVFDYLSESESCILEQKPFMALATDRQMVSYRHDGYWQCMDTMRDVQQLNEEWRSGKPGWLE